MNIQITILLTIFNAYLIEGPKKTTNGQKVLRSAIKLGNTIPDPHAQTAVQLMAGAYKIAPQGFTNYRRAVLKLAADLVKESAAHALAFGAVGMGANADEAYLAARGLTHNAAKVGKKKRKSKKRHRHKKNGKRQNRQPDENTKIRASKTITMKRRNKTAQNRRDMSSYSVTY
ncbi:hypothetical protein Ddc_04482 [Ditylenchus destructor]|nr:hypothetical protein Ddc_04482 [Ditylenchus destructor]